MLFRIVRAIAPTLILCTVLVGPVLVPRSVRALTLAAGDMVEVYKPKSLGKSTFSMKVVAMTLGDGGDPVSTRTYTMKGSKAKTVFRVSAKDGETYRERRVPYNTFVKYFNVRWAPTASVEYVWKKDAHGKKYRYIRSVNANKYAN